ncbi:LOW QUALITY PROTEIN: olfactory receptor 52D1-like [Carettochelys insculpta]|uniref:LOW QUALITY PROTEIN: olfactory receptor 52D1-like n=1 Tax=Carettochelys insculpta TaxID=44489 RepID=UPI003EC10470
MGTRWTQDSNTSRTKAKYRGILTISEPDQCIDHLMATFNLTLSEPPTFTLAGIPGLEAAHAWISIPFCMFYIIALLGNFMVLFVVGKEQTLHKPMYLLLCMLALTDMGISTSVVPKALCIFWFNLRDITEGGCLTQMFFLHAVSVMHSAVLVTMAFDRYVAICNPLRYATILSNARIAQLGLVGLVRAVLSMLPLPLLLSRLPFCANRIIPHTYCEHMAVAKTSCGDITVSRMYGLVMAFVIIGLDVTLVSLSYCLIFRAVLRISSKKAHPKALDTCTAHICVMTTSCVLFLFSSLTHRFGHGIAPHAHIILADLFFLIPPMLNPIIYGVKTKELRVKVSKYTCRRWSPEGCSLTCLDMGFSTVPMVVSTCGALHNLVESKHEILVVHCVAEAVPQYNHLGAVPCHQVHRNGVHVREALQEAFPQRPP